MTSAVGSVGFLEQQLKQTTGNKLPTFKRRKNEMWREVKSVLETLKTQMTRVKTEGIKKSVGKLTSFLCNCMKVRDEHGPMWRSRLDCTGRSTAEVEDKLASRLDASEGRIMSALKSVAARLTSYDRCLVELGRGGTIWLSTAFTQVDGVSEVTQ